MVHYWFVKWAQNQTVSNITLIILKTTAICVPHHRFSNLQKDGLRPRNINWYTSFLVFICHLDPPLNRTDNKDNNTTTVYTIKRLGLPHHLTEVRIEGHTV